jgi:hypothetical protein
MAKLAAICAALGLAGLLGGCNMVTSTTPLFFDRDTAGQAQLRPGVWVSQEKDCKFDAALPVTRWPSCADWVIVRKDALVSLDTKTDPPKWVSQPYVLALGDPPVVQSTFTGKDGDTVYLFGAVKPAQVDASGAIVQFRSWPALCGPPRTPKKGQPLGTAHPFAGLAMDPDGNNCVAHSADVVRNAARLSETFADPNPTLPHWVRDEER